MIISEEIHYKKNSTKTQAIIFFIRVYKNIYIYIYIYILTYSVLD